MSAAGPSVPRPKPPVARTGAGPLAEPKVIRRRRSRSVESRRSRKENAKETIASGKKRKTAEERPASPGPVPDAAMSQSHQRKQKGSRGRSAQRPIFDNRGGTAGTRTLRSEAVVVLSSDAEDEPELRKLQQKRLPPVPHAPSPPIAAPCGDSTHTRLRQQIIELKKEAEVAKQQALKQKQINEEMGLQLAAIKRANRQYETNITKMKTAAKKSEEVLSNIQSNLQCQICLELLLKPYALSPCGHVLCQGCLQEWFRSAPAQAHEQDDDGPLPPIYRRKTCPCCRTHIYTRPVQLFLIKSIVSAVSVQATASTTEPTAADDAADPWADIFPEEEGSEDDYEDDGGEGEVEDEEIDRDAWSIDMGFSGSDGDYAEVEEGGYIYGSDSDAEPYGGLYVRPDWSPPILDIERVQVDTHVTGYELRLMRRGVPLGMINRFTMSYDERFGLLVKTDEGNEIYLGWNIEVDEHDETGEEFMAWVEHDIIERSERWDYEDDPHGYWTAWRLVPADEPVEYIDAY